MSIHEKYMFLCFTAIACQTSGKTLSSSFHALHIKRLKFRSQTLVKSLFGIIGQTIFMLAVVLSHALKSSSWGTWEDPFHCNCLLLESAG